MKRRYKTKGWRNSLPDKLQWLRSVGCMICGKAAEVHHHRKFGARADDRNTLPLCAHHHRTGDDGLEQLGRRGFEERYGIGFDDACVEYHDRWEWERQCGGQSDIPMRRNKPRRAGLRSNNSSRRVSSGSSNGGRNAPSCTVFPIRRYSFTGRNLWVPVS